jgi:hypothetical protein
MNRLFNYSHVVEAYSRHAMYAGAGIGATYWVTDDSRKGSSTFLGNVAGAGLCTGIGMLGGLGTLTLYPLVLAGLAVGGPTYLIQRVGSKTT